MPRPARPATAPAPVDPLADAGAAGATADLSPEQIAERIQKRRTAQTLSLEEIDQLQRTYREVAVADDEEAKSITRSIVSRLRRVTHAELHPDCPDVTLTVPYSPFYNANGPIPYRINEVPYVGEVTVSRCVAQELLGMIDRVRQAEAERMRDGGRTIDLDSAVRARAAAIQAA